jgi:hypothetical protein
MLTPQSPLDCDGSTVISISFTISAAPFGLGICPACPLGGLEQEAHDMRALKLTVAMAGVLFLIRYIPVYYYTSEFNEFVKQEAQRNQRRDQLKLALLNRAKDYSLSLTEADINITTHDGVFRVAVDYKTPLDFLVYRPELTFHATGAGLARE